MSAGRGATAAEMWRELQNELARARRERDQALLRIVELETSMEEIMENAKMANHETRLKAAVAASDAEAEMSK
jgi:hypothetical protein